MELIKHDYTVGDDVSYGFNGDWYYAGKVVKITKKYLTTDHGQRYYLKEFKSRVYDTATFDYVDVIKEYFVSVGNGTWTLVKGIKEEMNPHF
jgi:hypothetical protein